MYSKRFLQENKMAHTDTQENEVDKSIRFERRFTTERNNQFNHLVYRKVNVCCPKQS